MKIGKSLSNLSNDLYKKLEERWEEVKKYHFNEDGGSPYWLKKIRTIDLKVSDVKHMTLEEFLESDLSQCDENEVNKERPLYFVPKKLWNEPHQLYFTTSSGSINRKKTIGWHKDSVEENACHIFNSFKKYWEIPEYSKFLIIGPSYPAPFQLIIRRLVELLKGFLYFAPLETRGIKKLLSQPETVELIFQRIEPALEYFIDILCKEEINFISSTPEILLYLKQNEEISKKLENITYIYFGGIEVSREMLEKTKKEYPHSKILTSYGHYMFGLTFDSPNEPLTYYPYIPRILFFTVRDKNEPSELVNVGQRGYVRFVVLSKELLWSQVERDTAIRVVGDNGVDGVREIQPKFSL